MDLSSPMSIPGKWIEMENNKKKKDLPLKIFIKEESWCAYLRRLEDEDREKVMKDLKTMEKKESSKNKIQC